jgi:hypothetical protein
MVVRFDRVDAAYLAYAEVQRRLDRLVPRGIAMVPTRRGPAVDVSASAARNPIVQAVIAEYGGHWPPS